MRRTLLVAVLAAAACGGSHKSTTPPPPLPEAKTDTPPPEDKKPEAKPEKAEPAEPPPGPLDVTVAAPKVTVKLVNAGKGKKAALKVSAKQGDKQAVELALDFTGKQSGPPEAGGTQEAVYPTLVLMGSAEVKSVDKDGATAYEVTVSGTDVRENQGQQIPTSVMKQALALIKDLKIGGTISANGTTGDVKMHVDKGDKAAQSVLELVRGATLPWWPVLPTEPIGVGAKWQVTATTKVSDKLDVTQTTDYELVDHKANKWTVKGTTKVSGTEQTVDEAKLSAIKGNGTIEVAMIDGALYPTIKSSLETQFDATVVDPKDKEAKPIAIHFDLKQGTAVTAK
jgi:hypothetical protein